MELAGQVNLTLSCRVVSGRSLETLSREVARNQVCLCLISCSRSSLQEGSKPPLHPLKEISLTLE